jgi:hypothetical protein
VFDVWHEGSRIFSKHDEGDDFPDPEDVIRRIEARQGR